MSLENPSVNYRFATTDDVSMLAGMNAQLIPDEGHRNRLTERQLIDRMTGWIGEGGDYKGVLFSLKSRPDPVAYALYRLSKDGIYLRQFFVARDSRRQGVGRSAMRLLIDEIWPGNVRLTVDVLAGNTAAIEFWKAVGYQSYSVCLEIVPS